TVSASKTPPGVTIQALPSTRADAAAHPAVLTHAATGPRCPAVTFGSTKIAPPPTPPFTTKNCTGLDALLTPSWHDCSMRAVHLVSRSQGRGAETAAVELADELSQLGHENRLMAIGLAFDGTREPRLPPLIDTERLSALTLVRSVKRLREALVREPADVVI